MNEEELLWANVLLQAVKDGYAGPWDEIQNIRNPATKVMYRNVLKHRARTYFRLSNRDFVTVCLMARLDPHKVKKVAENVFAEYDRTGELPFINQHLCAA